MAAVSEGDSNPGTGLRLTAIDGYELAATLFPARGEPRGMVVVQGATGVRRQFYRRFAAHLATSGLSTLTFDYRGIGDSLQGSPGDLEYDMSSWAELDAPAARAEALRLAAGRPLFVVAHSFGGQALAIAPPREPVVAAVLIGCQEGDVRHWPWRLLPWFLFGVGFVIPLTTRLWGYVPAWAGFGEPLPGRVARQWARWCRTRGYVFGARPEVVERAATIRFPMLGLNWSDDHYAPEPAARALAARFRDAPLDLRFYPAGKDHGGAVGHFGFFRRGGARLWSEPTDWMLNRLE